MGMDTEAVAAAASGQYITFTVGAGEYAVDVMAVREIRRWSDTTALPNTAPHVRGVINLRGVIVPIFDLRARFGQGMTEAGPFHVVIIVALAGRLLGGLVDAVSDIITAAPDTIRPAPEVERLPEERFLDGVITHQDRMIALVNLSRLFESELG